MITIISVKKLFSLKLCMDHITDRKRKKLFCFCLLFASIFICIRVNLCLKHHMVTWSADVRIAQFAIGPVAFDIDMNQILLIIIYHKFLFLRFWICHSSSTIQSLNRKSCYFNICGFWFSFYTADFMQFVDDENAQLATKGCRTPDMTSPINSATTIFH